VTQVSQKATRMLVRQSGLALEESHQGVGV